MEAWEVRAAWEDLPACPRPARVHEVRARGWSQENKAQAGLTAFSVGTSALPRPEQILLIGTIIKLTFVEDFQAPNTLHTHYLNNNS